MTAVYTARSAGTGDKIVAVCGFDDVSTLPALDGINNKMHISSSFLFLDLVRTNLHEDERGFAAECSARSGRDDLERSSLMERPAKPARRLAKILRLNVRQAEKRAIFLRLKEENSEL